MFSLFSIWSLRLYNNLPNAANSAADLGRRVGEMAWWLKYLSIKHEDWDLDSRHSQKIWVCMEAACNTSAQKAERRGPPQGSCRANYSSCRTQGSSRDCLSFKWRAIEEDIWHQHWFPCAFIQVHMSQHTYTEVYIWTPLKIIQAFMDLMVSQNQVTILTFLYDDTL